MRVLGACLLFALVTLGMTWPFATHLNLMDPGDSAYFAWALGWEVHALKTDPLQLPHGNMYHPSRYTIWMDEPILGTTLTVLPFSLFTDDAVVLFNLARLMTFVLSGLTAFLLARELRANGPISFLAGAAFAFSPIRTDQISHLSTLGSQWLPLVCLFTLRYSRSGRGRDALLAAFCYVLSAYACGYHGIFGLLTLPAFALPLVWKRWQLLPRAIPAVLLAVAGLIPLKLLHAAAFEAEGFSRPVGQAIFHSASLESFLATSSWNHLYGELTTPFRTIGSNNLFPGACVVLLVLAGAARLWRERTAPSREAVAFALMGLVAVIAALGPEVRLMGHELFKGPFGYVREWVPIFESVRVNSRAGIYLALALSGLATLGLRRLELSELAVWGLVAVILLEGLVAPIPMPKWMQVIDTRKPLPEVYAWLRQQPGEFPIAEMPLLQSDGLFRRPSHEETVYMVWSTWHWKRLVNGNAGVEPFTYRQIREACRKFPSPECLALLKVVGTRYVVVHEKGYGPNQWKRVSRDLPGFADRLEPVQAFGGGDTVYAVK